MGQDVVFALIAAVAVVSLVGLRLIRRTGSVRPDAVEDGEKPPAHGRLPATIDRSVGMFVLRRLTGRAMTGGTDGLPAAPTDTLSVDELARRIGVAERIPSGPARSPGILPHGPRRRLIRDSGLALIGLATLALVIVTVMPPGRVTEPPRSGTPGAITRATPAAADVATPVAAAVATAVAAAAATPSATDPGAVLDAVDQDTTRPIVAAPAPRFDGQMIGRSLVRLRLGWSGTDAGSGIVKFQLQQQVNGGTFATVTLPSAKSTSIDRTLPYDGSYRYRVRATDAAGNASAYVYGPTFKLLRYQETSSAFTYSGSWSQTSSPSLSGGRGRHTSSASSTLTFRTSARDIAWFATMTSTSGSADVSVDGVFVATVDLHAASTAYRQLVFQRHFETTATHTIVIRPRGGARIDIDAFAIAR